MGFNSGFKGLKSHVFHCSVYVTSLTGLTTRSSSTSYVKLNAALWKRLSKPKCKSLTYRKLPTWITGWPSGANWWVQPAPCMTSPSGCSTSPKSSSLWSTRAVSSHRQLPSSDKVSSAYTLTNGPLCVGISEMTDEACSFRNFVPRWQYVKLAGLKVNYRSGR